MASTYSNLKIQLMATGENSTTWGNVTNINLGTAIEEAIVASADVSFSSGNVTLTLTDTNATQTARHLRLRCTGTTGGSTRNLVVPSIEKPYIVQNDCADSILVKTAAGSGITVPAGKTMWVYSDATNVVDVVNHLTTLTLGTPLPIAQGGTGANTAAGARTNLGIPTVGTIATQDANNVNITGGSITGITDLAVADGGTGASNASGARTNLGLGSMATQNSSTVTITGGSITGITDLAVADGGTGASTASDARTNLGLGTMATQSAGAVAITGGTIAGVAISGITDLAVADGGTGASNASGARTNLGAAASGANSDITSLAGLTTALSIAQGGTGATTASAAIAALGGLAAGGTVTFGANSLQVEIEISGETLLIVGGHGTLSGNTTGTVTYGVTFDPAPVVVLSGGPTGTSSEGDVHITAAPGTTSVAITNSSPNTGYYGWLAIGAKA